jgi:hypothetical protein
MPAWAWRGPLLGAIGAILTFAAAACAQSPDATGVPPLDFSAPSDGDDAHNWSMSVFYGYETFRGISDGNWQNNGLNTGFNFGTRLGEFSDWTGIGFQAGGSIGIYNWSGTDYRMDDQNEAQTQGFITTGFFRKATVDSPWTAGLVFDWMINNNFGIFNESPTLNQWRYRLGYLFNDCNEIGVWGTVHGQDSTRDVRFFGPVTWRAEDQISVFSHHKWQFGADTTLWIGAPLGHSLENGFSLGSFIAGARGDMPLSDLLALYAQVTYMRPSFGPGPAAAEHDEWSFVIGLTIYPRHDSRTPTVANEGWAALLPVANNGTFFVDTNRYY